MKKVVYYKKPNGRKPVNEFINSLPETSQARIVKTIELLGDYGLAIGMPHVKFLKGVRGGWELRVKADDLFYRFGFRIIQETPIIVHGFVKKTNKADTKDLAIIKKGLRRSNENNKF